MIDPFDKDMAARVLLYSQKYGLQFNRRLGFGKDGSVWQTDRRTAVKVFRRPEPYGRELATYRRLADRNITEIRGHAVPQLFVMTTPSSHSK